MLLSKRVVCDSKKLEFIKEQEASGLLSSLGIKNQKKLVFNMIWLMEILQIYPEEQLLIKHCMIKHLISLKIQNMMGIKGVLLQWFKSFLKDCSEAVKNENMSNKE